MWEKETQRGENEADSFLLARQEPCPPFPASGARCESQNGLESISGNVSSGNRCLLWSKCLNLVVHKADNKIKKFLGLAH
jgi:hypothetical protein